MNNFKLSSTAKSYIEKTAQSYKYKHDPYLNIKNLINLHRDLIIADDFEGSNRWIEHLENELMRFWMKPEVKDMSKGLFRSFLINDGKHLPGLDAVDQWPAELRKAIQKDENGNYSAEAGDLLEGPEKNADKNFVRVHSRQTFAYGVAYNMTGKPEYFELCRKGAYALMELIGNNGSMFTRQHLSKGDFINDTKTRTSQDLAYGMTGIAFYYYLTHDEAVLDKIRALKNYIFDNYFHQGKEVFTWLPHKNTSKEQSVELVAHLDQLYAYMLWLTPSLPAKEKNEYKADMKRIADIMIEKFYSEVYGTFWGASTSSDMQTLGTSHTDFGHSVKAMWVIYQVGIWTDQIYYVNFARQKIHAILESAFDVSNGSWNRRILDDGSIDRDKEWWGLAELNQAAALLAIKDPSYLQYLNKTYAFWFKNMIDYKHGEIWHVLDGETLYPKQMFPKAHCWKNGLHSLEHCLFGYLTSKQILGENIELYYAFTSIDEVKHQTVTPYLFKANIIDQAVITKNNEEVLINDGDVDRLNIKVTFEFLH
ncbi:MAG: AGE family epimerase/isomerase [Lachnospiraceae bacterium]|nr:AGE family epimerase/isomerase [Lachnospiraceae bacterium]